MSKANVLLETGIDELRREAERLDPKAAARVLGNDPQRLLRIVSVALGTDRPLSAWQDSTKPEIPNEFWRGAVILPDRAGLYQRINQRFDAMAENGGIAEAKAVLERRLDPSLPVMKAIGLPPLMDHLEGKLSLEEAIERAKRDTRRFAKRQFTWLRGQNAEWTCVDSQTPADQIWQNIA
jgi:tRNA dimethylallyltransferase